MEIGEYYSLRGYTLFVHLDRDTASVVSDRAGAVRLQRHPYVFAVSRQMLIDGIVQNLVDEMVETLRAYASDVHTRSFADCLQSLEHRDTVCIVL